MVQSSTNTYKQVPAIARRWPAAPAGFKMKPRGRNPRCAPSPAVSVSSPPSWVAWFSSHRPTACARWAVSRGLGKENNQPGTFTPSPHPSALPWSSQGRCADEGQFWGAQIQTPTAKRWCFGGEDHHLLRDVGSKMTCFVGP